MILESKYFGSNSFFFLVLFKLQLVKVQQRHVQVENQFQEGLEGQPITISRKAETSKIRYGIWMLG